EGGHKMEFFDSNGKLRGMKRDLYEGGLRVPLLARWPSHIKAGTVSTHVSGFQDMLPTFAELASAEMPSELDGISMLPELLGQGDQAQHEYLYWEFSEQKGKRAVLQGDWKLVQLQVATKQPSEYQLYNVAQDTGESQDLASENPELVKSLMQLLDQAHQINASYPLFLSERN
ncbi:MAG: sulfatase/phosphatase domain-containing protein, partial [Planctomycetota bacterium]